MEKQWWHITGKAMPRAISVRTKTNLFRSGLLILLEGINTDIWVECSLSDQAELLLLVLFGAIELEHTAPQPGVLQSFADALKRLHGIVSGESSAAPDTDDSDGRVLLPAVDNDIEPLARRERDLKLSIRFEPPPGRILPPVFMETDPADLSDFCEFIGEASTPNENTSFPIPISTKAEDPCSRILNRIFPPSSKKRQGRGPGSLMEETWMASHLWTTRRPSSFQISSPQPLT